MSIPTLNTLEEVRAAAARLCEVAEALRRDWYDRELDPLVRHDLVMERGRLSLAILFATGVQPYVNSGPTPTQIKASPELRRIVRERREAELRKRDSN